MCAKIASICTSLHNQFLFSFLNAKPVPSIIILFIFELSAVLFIPFFVFRFVFSPSVVTSTIRTRTLHLETQMIIAIIILII